MMNESTSKSAAAAGRKRVTMERTFVAPIEDVWELWTTKDGIESWWGPDGFQVKVSEIDLRPGGLLLYSMTAVGADQVAFMKQAKMPLTQHCRITYTEVVAPRRLGYNHLADFIPGVEPYDVATLVELIASGDQVQMRLTFDAMHEPYWTQMAVAGWESELDKLARRLGQPVTAPGPTPPATGG